MKIETDFYYVYFFLEKCQEDELHVYVHKCNVGVWDVNCELENVRRME